MSPIKHRCLFSTCETVENFAFTRGDIVTVPLSTVTGPTNDDGTHIRIVPVVLLWVMFKVKS